MAYNNQFEVDMLTFVDPHSQLLFNAGCSIQQALVHPHTKLEPPPQDSSTVHDGTRLTRLDRKHLSSLSHPQSGFGRLFL